MRNLCIIVFVISLVFSCDNRKDKEDHKPENIYDTTKVFKTDFKFIIDEQDKNVESYWFYVDNWQNGSTTLYSDGIHGWENMFEPEYRENTKTINTTENSLNNIFAISIIVTDKVKRSPWELRQRIYKSDPIRFKNIKDSIRIIRYPRDTLTLIKRYYPPGHPKYKPK